MKVRHFKDPETGQWFREISYSKYSRLLELEKEYRKRGAKTYMTIYGKGNFSLTVYDTNRI